MRSPVITAWRPRDVMCTLMWSGVCPQVDSKRTSSSSAKSFFTIWARPDSTMGITLSAIWVCGVSLCMADQYVHSFSDITYRALGKVGTQRPLSHVVGVEVGGHDVVDLLRPDSRLGEPLEIRAARRHVPVGARALLVVAHAGVHHDGVVPGLDQERLHREDEAVHRRVQGPARQPLPIGRPLLGRDLREEPRRVEVRALRLEDPVDGDLADLLLQHGRPP